MAYDFFSIKAFVSYGALNSNAANVVSNLGELSLYCGTFAKDRQLITTNTETTPDTTADITIFTCNDTVPVKQVIPPVIEPLLKGIAKWCYGESINGTFSGMTNTFSSAFITEFGDRTEGLVVGGMVNKDLLWLPSYITFFVKTDVVYDPPESMPEANNPMRVRLWFSDAAFSTQYDDFEINFIPPVDDIDSLLGSANVVAQQLGQRTPPELTMLIQDSADGKPFTVVRTLNFKYHYKNSFQQTANAYWTFVIWGAYGDNIDILRMRLAEWILANSAHTQAEWSAIFPDIFAATEFIVVPLWNQYAIPNLTLDYAMYSPSVTVEDAQTMLHGTAIGQDYTVQHVDDNASFLSVAYKSIACLAVGGPHNLDNKFVLMDVIPDYIAVPPSSIDFDRMSNATRNWAYHIFSMLLTAETMTEASDLPAGMMRVKRTNANNDEILYLVSTINDIQYLMVSKQSLNTLWPPVDRSANPIVFSPDPTVTVDTSVGIKRLQLNISVTGGTAPYTYSASSADIEPGGQIDPTTGYLDVTFTNWGTNTIDVTVTDSKGFPKTETYTVVSIETPQG